MHLCVCKLCIFDILTVTSSRTLFTCTVCVCVCVCVCVHLILIICHYMSVHVIRYQLIQVLMMCVCADSLRVWSVPLTVFIIIVEHKSGVLISHA